MSAILVSPLPVYSSSFGSNFRSIGSAFLRCSLPSILFLAAAAEVAMPRRASADESDPFKVQWQEVSPGLHRADYELTSPGAAIRSDVVLLKFSLSKFEIQAVNSEKFGRKRNDIISLTKKAGGIAGINANFFDPEENALGLVIQDGEKQSRLHNGGDLLSGIFYVKSGKAAIVHRSEFNVYDAEIAVQAGPRLISNGKIVDDQQPQPPTRRSGVAITKSGDVIIFATRVRFPGASIGQIQRMLMQPSLEITDALNLDGGSSSQIYLELVPRGEEPLWITGGDVVPIGLVFKKKG